MHKTNLFDQLFERIINDLENNLPTYLSYHNTIHTRYVLEKSILIAKEEKVSDHELFLLKIAALYHDTGYKNSYENHETESCKIAESELPELGFSKTEIGQICGMIMATRIPQSPKNKLEEILADADLEYLGTAYFEVKSDNLFKELQFLNSSLTEEKWNQLQISFLQKHHYFTRFCIENRAHIKQSNLDKLLHINQ